MKQLTYILLFLSSIVTAQNGNVGINTNSPTAALHVHAGDVLFTGLINPPASPLAPPASGAGSRFMWYPDKAALRIGTVTGAHWDQDSTGLYSIALGYDVKAKGYSSMALGTSAESPGSSSFSIGTNTRADGFASFAIGHSASTASLSNQTVSIGYGASSAGTNTLSLGYNTSATGNFSTSIGYGSSTTGQQSLAIGNSCIASGAASFAIGNSTIASGQSATSIGSNGTAAGINSFMIGHGNTAMGNNSFAMGTNSMAKGTYSVTSGYSLQSNGYAGFVAGMYNDTLVATQTAVTETTPLFTVGNGDGANVRSNAFVVRKDGNVGIGNVNPLYGLHIVNSETGNNGWRRGIVIENTAPDSTPGEASIALRNGSLPSTKQWIIGINQSQSGITYSYGDNLTITNTKMYLDTLGNLGLGTSTPSFRMHIENNNPGSGGWQQGLNIQNTAALATAGEAAISFHNNALPADRYWIAGINQQSPGLAFNYGLDFTAGDTRLYIDTTGQVGIGLITPSFTLEVDGTAGKPGGGAWTASSDARLKQNIQPYTDGLEQLLQIRPVRYHYNARSGYDTQPEYIGVIAQELQPIAPYMVNVSDKILEDGTSGFLTVDNSAMTYMLINAVKELQAEIESLSRELDSIIAEIRATK